MGSEAAQSVAAGFGVKSPVDTKEAESVGREVEGFAERRGRGPVDGKCYALFDI
jgi:hypothetical protein